MMKRLYKGILAFLCLTLVILCPSAIANAEEAILSPVTISDFGISTKNAKKGDVVKYSFTLTDVGIQDFLEKYGERYDIYSSKYGVSNVTLCWSSSKKQRIIHTYKWEEDEALKNTTTLKISGKIPVEKGMQRGEWRLTSIYFDAGMDGEGFYIKDSRIENADISMNFSVADFTVSGTGKADNKAPTINLSSLKVSKRYIKKNQKSTFCVKVNDQSKIVEVKCIWYFYEK